MGGTLRKINFDPHTIPMCKFMYIFVIGNIKMDRDNQNNPNDNKDPKYLEENDFKSLVQNRGQISKGENAYELKSPSHDDQELQKVVKHPEFKVKPLGNAPKKGETCHYDLSCGKETPSVKATVACK